jgi:hypothetical protein
MALNQSWIERMVQSVHELVAWQSTRKLPAKTKLLIRMAKHEQVIPRDLITNLKANLQLKL